MKSVEEFYDDMYGTDPNAFGGEPIPLVRRLLEHIKPGQTVLDLGAGRGRNVLFLAQSGFRVTAVDISQTGLDQLKAQAAQSGVEVATVHSDIVQYDFSEIFDAIMCVFTLHHLSRTDALSVIKRMQAHTKTEGINIVMSFTKDGDFFRNHPEAGNFYLESKEELARLYADWEVIQLFEKEGQARALDKDGNRQVNVFAGILAKKK